MIQVFVENDPRFAENRGFFKAQAESATTALFDYAASRRAYYCDRNNFGGEPAMLRMNPDLPASPENFLVWQNKNAKSTFYKTIRDVGP